MFRPAQLANKRVYIWTKYMLCRDVQKTFQLAGIEYLYGKRNSVIPSRRNKWRDKKNNIEFRLRVYSDLKHM
jgi:hypothetical protein